MQRKAYQQCVDQGSQQTVAHNSSRWGDLVGECVVGFADSGKKWRMLVQASVGFRPLQVGEGAL